MPPPFCIWALVDDRPGTAAQALGVAEKLGVPFECKELRYNNFARLPNILLGASLLGIASCPSPLAPPWPDLVIAAGRRAAPVALYIKKHSPNTKLVQLMQPGGCASRFDLIAVPEHDRRPLAANVMRTLLTPHRLTQAGLGAAAAQWRARLAHLPRPYVTVLLGGNSRHGAWRREDYIALLTQAQKLAGQGSLLITTSRRTDPAVAALVAQHVTAPHYLHAWSAGGDNPYLAFLALAESIIVTGDSMSMISEACFTAAPVYIAAPTGSVSPKHERLHGALYARGLAAPLGGEFLSAAVDIAAADIVQKRDAAAEIARVIAQKFLPKGLNPELNAIT